MPYIGGNGHRIALAQLDLLVFRNRMTNASLDDDKNFAAIGMKMTRIPPPRLKCAAANGHLRRIAQCAIGEPCEMPPIERMNLRGTEMLNLNFVRHEKLRIEPDTSCPA